MPATKPIILDLEKLPDDLNLLKSLVVDQATEIEKLRNQLHDAIRRQYGRKSEGVSKDQMALFEKMIEDKLARLPKAPEVSEEKKIKVSGHGRRKPSRELPRKVEHYPLAEEKKICDGCGETRQKIGEDKRHLIEYIPSSIFIHEIIVDRWACSSCKDKVVTADAPQPPVKRGIAGAGLLAQVVTSKYADHLPLYRQAEIFARCGFEVNRSTLCNFTEQVADLFVPLFQAMKEDVFKSKVIHTDDTPVPVLEDDHNRHKAKDPPGEDADAAADDPQGKRKARKGRLWIYAGDRDHPHIVFDYTPDWKKEGPANFIGDWQGFQQADSYSGYDSIYAKNKVVEVSCWAHARRKFEKAKDIGESAGKIALAYIRQLYRIEKLAKKKAGVEKLDQTQADQLRLELRQKHSKPLAELFKQWMDAQALITLPSSATGKAITYALNHWDALLRYMHDPDLAIDNNPAERGLRCIAVGRKSWLFAGSDKGGKRAAILYSFVASCKRHQIDPFAYLRDVIGRVGNHPPDCLAELLPANWKAARLASQITQ